MLQHFSQAFDSRYHPVVLFQDLGVLTDSIQKLQAIQQHFLASQEHTKQMETISEGAEVLVPLCDGVSLFVFFLNVVIKIHQRGSYFSSSWSEEKLLTLG